MVPRIPARLLLALPIFVYLVAYGYLAFYHGRWNLIGTVIHEGGTFTLWETTLYASHFLGHIPVHVVIALLFWGVYRCYSGTTTSTIGSLNRAMITTGLFLLLGGSLLLSLFHFGREDTFSYILQRKQGVDNFVRGGSWNLHLGSTTIMFILMPVYVFAIRFATGKPILWKTDGLIWIFAAALILPTFTLLVNGSILQPLKVAWTDPRYLAHSVRELATFPLTYFPIPLYFLLTAESDSFNDHSVRVDRRATIAVAGFTLLFILGFAYQVILPLRVGISDLAQNPGFSGENGLGVPYLLASHYFEHFLDTIFFCLLTLLLASFNRRKRI